MRKWRGLFSFCFKMLTGFFRAEWVSGSVLNEEAIKFAPKLSCVTNHCILSVPFHSQPAKLPLSQRRCMCPFHPTCCSLLPMASGSCLSVSHCLLSSSSLPFPKGPGKLCWATGPHAQGCPGVVKATPSRAPVIPPSVCSQTTWMGMIF